MNKIILGSTSVGALIGAVQAYRDTPAGTELTLTVLASDLGLVMGGAVIFWLVGSLFVSVAKGS